MTEPSDCIADIAKPSACEGCSFYSFKGDGDFYHNCTHSIASDMGTACWAITGAGGETCDHRSGSEHKTEKSAMLTVCSTCKYRGKITLGTQFEQYVCTAPTVVGDKSFVKVHDVRETYVENAVMRSRCAHHLHRDAVSLLPVIEHKPQVLCKDCKHIDAKELDMAMSTCKIAPFSELTANCVVTGEVQKRPSLRTATWCFMLNEFGDCKHFEHVDAETETPVSAVKKKRVVMLCSQKTQ